MEFSLHCAQWSYLYFLVPFLGVLFYWRLFYAKKPVYRYSLAGVLQRAGFSYPPTYKKIFFMLRALTLIILAFLILKPRIVDTRSVVPVEGIDIMLVLDVSGSMQYQDYEDDQRSRLEVAKHEAIRFVNKRTNDAIGVVIFAKDALSRIPLTLDKNVLKHVIQELQIGIIDHDGTMLATAMMAAANRLKNSTAKSKVMILLTDGTPSEGDISPALAIDAAKQLGIRVYTIGIGSEDDQFFMHPLYGLIPKPKVNKELLMRIAYATDGKFFMARRAADMRAIYETIDSLEKSTIETPLYHAYYDIFMPFVVGCIFLLIAELLLATFLFYGLWS